NNTVAGGNNSFFGVGSGFTGTNNSGNDNSVLGYGSQVTADLSNQTAVGSRAMVTRSNSLVLGAINGVNGATADTNVGIGITAPTERLHVGGNGFFTGSLFANSIGANTMNVSGGGAFITLQAQSLTIPQTSSFGVSTPRLTVGGP